MNTFVEKRSDNNGKSISSAGDKANKRYRGRCCFGLISLRSGIYIVSATSFIVTLYGLHEVYPSSGEDIDGITPYPRWSKDAFSILSFCTDAFGFYGAYHESARAIKYYRRMICIEYVLELACITTAYTSVYFSQKKEFLDPEKLAKWAIETERDLIEVRKMFTLMLLGVGAVAFLLPSAIEGFRMCLAGRYQRFLEEESMSSSYRDEQEK